MRFGHGELHLFLLALLSRHPMHGYELMGEMRSILGRRYRASPGSIYPALQALEDEGLVAAREDGDRRVYELTGEGAQAYTKRAHRIAAMEDRLGIRFTRGLDVMLARFQRRVWEAAQRVDESRIEEILEAAATQIETVAKNSEGGHD